MTLVKKFKQSLKDRFLGKQRFQSFFQWTFDLSIWGMNIGMGGADPVDNGEQAMLDRLGKNAPRHAVFFDVGAQTGKYIQAILNAFSDHTLRIYAFEPSSKEYAEITSKFDDNIVKTYNLALSNKPGQATLYAPQNISGLSSLYKRRSETEFSETQEVSVSTIDIICKEEHITDIYLLKLDVEGNGLNCLEGARTMIQEGRIQHIQFEFGAPSADAGIHFHEIFEFLHTQYNMYRILRDGLEPIHAPSRLHELLYTTNYLAIKK